MYTQPNCQDFQEVRSAFFWVNSSHRSSESGKGEFFLAVHTARYLLISILIPGLVEGFQFWVLNDSREALKEAVKVRFTVRCTIFTRTMNE